MTAHAPATLPQPGQTQHGPQATPVQRSSRPRTSSGISSAGSGIHKAALHAASSGPIVMSPEALQNNERLFPMFKAQLSEDRIDGNYLSAAEKLAGWLSKDKAYYQTARPWIVALIETAQDTIRRIAGNTLPQNQPFHVSQCPIEIVDYWVTPYIRIIDIVRHFDHMFIEPDLRARLEALFRTVDGPQVPLVHAPAASAPRRRSSGVVRTPTSVTPAPYAVPAPMPAPMPAVAAPMRYIPPNSAGSTGYYTLPHHTPPPPMPAPPLNVNIPPTMPYQHHVGSPMQTSPSASSPYPIFQQGPPSRPVSRPGSSNSVSTMSTISTMPARPSSASSHAAARVVSAPVPPSAAPPTVPTPPTPDPSASVAAAPAAKRKKAKRILTDFMLDDVEWFREKMEKEKQEKHAAEQPAPAAAAAPSEPGSSKEAVAEAKVEELPQELPQEPAQVLGPSPADQPVDDKPPDPEQDVEMADATAAVAEAEAAPRTDEMAVDDNEPPVETPMEVEPEAPSVPLDAPISDATEGTKESETAAVPAAPAEVPAAAAAEPPPSTPSTMTVAPISPARILDLSKLGSPTAAKAKKPVAPDLVYSKVAQPSEAASAIPEPPIAPAAVFEPQIVLVPDEPSSPAPIPTDIAPPAPSEVAVPIPSETTALPPSEATVPVPSETAASAPNDIIPQGTMVEGFSHKVKSPKSKKGPPGIKASEFAARTPTPSTPTTPSDTESVRAGIILHSKTGSGLKLKLLPPKPPSPSSVKTTGEPFPTPKKSKARATAKRSAASDSEDDEPLSAVRRRRASGQYDALGLKRARSRSQSPDTPLAQRRKSSLVVRTQAREYTVDAFNSGTFVYSPIQASTPAAVTPGDMDVDERAGVLPPSAMRAPRPAKVKKPLRTAEEMGLLVEPFTEKELKKMPMFRDGTKILAFDRGKRFGDATPIKFSFTLAQEEYDACSLWSKQDNINQLMNDLSFFKCLSLTCYNFADVDRRLQSLGQPSSEEVFAGKPGKFPWHQAVRLRIDGQDPPSFEVNWIHMSKNERDQLVDLSKRVRPGANTIELSAGKPGVDHSHFVFVLRLHPPTPRQAAYWWERKRNQVRWEKTLRGLSHIEVPPIDLGQFTKHTGAVRV